MAREERATPWSVEGAPRPSVEGEVTDVAARAAPAAAARRRGVRRRRSIGARSRVYGFARGSLDSRPFEKRRPRGIGSVWIQFQALVALLW